jgi:hypothetical protein
MPEAELLYMADLHDAVVATDSRVVFDCARRRFGSARVVDTVQILQCGIRMRLIGINQAEAAVRAMMLNGGNLRSFDMTHLSTAFFKAKPDDC